MKKNSKKEYLNRDEVNEMIESALRRHNRRSTIISSVLGWILIGGYSFGLFQVVQNAQTTISIKCNRLDDRLIQDSLFLMREYIKANLNVIRKHFKKRKKLISNLNNASIMEEFKEWSKDPIPETESIWTLPDLTRNERLKNFCRSIKKEIRQFF